MQSNVQNAAINRLVLIFVLVLGSGESLDEAKGLAKELNLDDRVEFRACLRGDDLNKGLLRSDLAIHRIGIRQASPIKTRHYLALGLPLIIGYEDVDLKADLPFVMRVPADESQLDAKAIEIFYKNVVADESICSQTREYAEQNLATEIKMRQLESFLNQTVS